MKIEVVSKIDRENAVFFAGEDFTVEVSITNVSAEHSNSLAWGCLQLHCDQVLLRSSAKSISSKTNPYEPTSVHRAKQAIYSSKPAILFCDIKLKPLEVLRYNNKFIVPRHYPPSYKGHWVKYIWYVSVATQHVDSPIKMTQLPLKILNVTIDITPSQPTTSNPFLLEEWEKDQPPLVDLVIAKTEEITSIRSQKAYEIKSGDVVFAVITFYKNVYKLGDDFIGSVKFYHNEISCVQFLVRLETVETNLTSIEEKNDYVNKHYSKYMWSAFIEDLHFKVPLPLTLTPTFTSDTSVLKWRIHFEFIISTEHYLKDEGEMRKLIKNDLNVETVSWKHNITVLSCSPHNVSMIVEMSPSCTFTI